jgi:hypothetical protein
MEDLVPFGSRVYLTVFGVLLLARGADFFSTWVATPNLVLEGNPVAKKLGWKWGILVNIVFCLGLSLWPLPALVIAVTSVLVAARNFQHAWLMRLLGEENYRSWHVDRLRETNISLFVFCLVVQSALIAAVGGVLMWFSPEEVVPTAVGMGLVAYAVAITFYTLLSVWRIRRAIG